MSRIVPFLIAGALSQQVLEETKGCPLGFEFVGKQCVQTLTTGPLYSCPAGTTLMDDLCAQYFPKTPECPAGFNLVGAQCQRVVTASPSVNCPAGYVLTEEGCLKQIELPPSYACPAGAVAKGDTCYAVTTAEPDHACAPGALLSGNLCIAEETYDCTPAVGEPGIVAPDPCGAAPGPLGATQSALLRAKAKFAATGKEHAPGDSDACEVCTGGQPPCSGPAPWTGSRPQFVEETLVSARCKRISVEPAAKLCRMGRLDGKICIIETPVDAITVPGGYSTEIAPSTTVCPAGFSPEVVPCGTLTCVRLETAPASFVCPCGTEDLGDRCATTTERRPYCEDGYHLSNGICTKTITAEPITEYTVRYTCAGKDCATV